MKQPKNLGMPTRFVAKAAELRGSYTGAGSGLFDPGEIAQQELGEINWGEAAMYFHRRFGPPNLPSDPDKEICRWVISTPYKGIFLNFTCSPNATWLLFGYIIERDLSLKLSQQQYARQKATRNRFIEWCNETHGRQSPLWEMSIEERYADPSKAHEAYRINSEWWAAFDAQDHEPSHDDDLHVAEEALRRAIRDLLRTVSVRDQDISIKGRGANFHGVLPYKHAGCAPPPTVTMEEQMWKVYGAIARLGGGKKGIDRLLRLVEKAEPTLLTPPQAN